MKTYIILIISLLLVVSIPGCQNAEASRPQVEAIIQPYQENAYQSQYAQYKKLTPVTAEPDPDGVHFRGIGFAADGAYLMVQFTAPLEQSGLWKQGYVYVMDEENQKVYREIPVMPIVGPLIGRPAKEGQIGYVMLLNPGYSIKSGSVVSVVLGNYKRENYTVP